MQYLITVSGSTVGHIKTKQGTGDQADAIKQLTELVAKLAAEGWDVASFSVQMISESMPGRNFSHDRRRL